MAEYAVAMSVFSSTVYEFLKYCLTRATQRDYFEKYLRNSFRKVRDQCAQAEPGVWARLTLEKSIRLQDGLIECLQSPEIDRDKFLRVLKEELKKEGLGSEEAEKFYSMVFDEFTAIVNKEGAKNPKVFMAIMLHACKKHGVRLDEIADDLRAMGLALDDVKTQLNRIEDLAKEIARERRVIVPTVQSVLRRNDPDISEGTFFRKEPAWVDFEEGFIVERREVNEIIGKLEKGKAHLVVGEPAAGKSVVLKNVGFKLAKENPHVYYVGLKTDSDQLKSYFEQILKVKDGQPVLIIDDAHLQLSACERLIRELRSAESEIKVLIGSRPIERIIWKSPRESSEFEYLNKTSLYAEDASRSIIRSFLRRKYDIRDHERIIKAIKELCKYCEDLWVLSWALETFDPESNSVDEERIYERIRDSIRGMGPGAEDALFPLSVFYQYEIPIDRSLLIKKIVLKEGVINRLIDQSEIIQVEQLGERQALSLAHSSIAKLYFKAYQNYPSFGESSKKHFLGDDIEYKMFSWYMLKSDPKDSLSITGRLIADHNQEYSGRILLSKLLQNNKIKDQILKGIRKGDNLDVIADSIVQLYAYDVKRRRALFKSLLDISTPLADTVLPKLDSETDLRKIGDFFYTFSIRAPKYCSYLALNIDHRVLLRRIEREKDVQKIGFCIFGISMASRELGLILIHSLDIDNLSSKLQKEDNMVTAIFTIFGVTELDEGLGVDLAKRVDFSKVKEEDLDVLLILWDSGNSRLHRIISDSNPRMRELRHQDLKDLRHQIDQWGADHRHYLRARVLIRRVLRVKGNSKPTNVNGRSAG